MTRKKGRGMEIAGLYRTDAALLNEGKKKKRNGALIP